MKTKEVVDDLTMKRAITRITYEIIERNKDLSQIVLVGIKTRGVYIARRIQGRLSAGTNRCPCSRTPDTSLPRWYEAQKIPTVLPAISLIAVILIDDVLLYRSHDTRCYDVIWSRCPARSVSCGSSKIRHREPIRPDLLGKISRQVSQRKSLESRELDESRPASSSKKLRQIVNYLHSL